MNSGQPFRVHQYHPMVTFGDAISNQMFFIRDALREAGIGGEIFAHRTKHLPEGSVRLLPSDAVWNGDLLLLHHSIGNPRLSEVLQYEIPRALVYHNITPDSFFAHDPQIQRLCRLGRKQLGPLVEKCSVLFAVSRFNARELPCSSGFGGCLPLFPLALKPQRADWAPGTPVRLLFVGRIAPHKNQELLIRALAELRANSPRDYRLHLVGGGDPLYLEFLRLTARRLGLGEHVHFAGRVSDEAKEGFYRNSCLFVSASLHEGFGVPLVEAMQWALPVVALDRAAAGETLGSAGVRVDSEDPRLLAAAVRTLVNDPSLARRVLAHQRLRLEELGGFCRAETVVETILPVLRSLRHSGAASQPELQP